MKEFYTPHRIAAFAPCFYLLTRHRGGEPYLALAAFHYGMLNHTLIGAVTQNKPDVVRFLLRYVACVKEDTLDWMGVIAAREGCVEVVRQFPCSIRTLEAAVYAGHTNVVEFLIDQNPTFIAEDMVEIACQRGDIAMVQLLIQKGQMVSDEAICAAAGYGHVELVKLLTADICPLTAVYRAVRCGQVEVLKLLIEQFMDELPYLLITAAFSGQLPVIKLLVDRGAHIELWMIESTRERGYLASATFLEEAYRSAREVNHNTALVTLKQ